MSAGERGLLPGDRSLNEHWDGSQRVVRCSCDTTHMPGTSWGGFSWYVLSSGSVAGHDSSVIEIVSKQLRPSRWCVEHATAPESSLAKARLLRNWA
jgi:hypothetical protein